MSREVIALVESLKSMQEHTTYKAGVEWGKPRGGHPEGKISLHIEELERNLERLKKKTNISEREEAKLRLLIHSHDTLKIHARPGVPIIHPYSHASLAKDFLSQFIDDQDLLEMVQRHDEPFSLYRKHKKGHEVADRIAEMIDAIEDLRTFLLFNIIDSCVEGKKRDPLIWFLHQIDEEKRQDIDHSCILPNLQVKQAT